MSKLRIGNAATPASDVSRREGLAESDSITAVVFALTPEDEATAKEWAANLKWRVVAAILDPAAVAASVDRNQARAVITTTAALRAMGREKTGWLKYQIAQAGGELYAAVIFSVAADTVVLSPVTVVPPSSLPGVAA